MELVQTLLLFASSILWFLAAAKTHGRQIRLEREYRGIDDVDFRREVQNHPWVEELWRKDRVGYWTIAAIVFLCVGAFAYAMPDVDGWAILPMSILFAMSIAFGAQGWRSHQRLRGSMLLGRAEGLGPNPRHDDLAWKRAARRGTLFWFFATYVLMLLSFAALAFSQMT